MTVERAHKKGSTCMLLSILSASEFLYSKETKSFVKSNCQEESKH